MLIHMNVVKVELLTMTSQTTCYYPDKSIATGFEPCNSTLAEPNGAGSACCATDDICTTGGYCFGDAYYPHRGACTDKSWNSGNCASECLSSEWPFPSCWSCRGMSDEMVEFSHADH